MGENVDRMQSKIDNKNRVNELINIVENYTRTERHLEQHSDISDPSNIRHVKELQNDRKEKIENIKENIVYGNGKSDEMKNLEKNFKFCEGYLENNYDKMNPEVLTNLREKQKNRMEKMVELKD
ncbi:hypothetical protein CLOACE_04830 [Clostridium acetireducens DSM 10703]|jgi:hypothetical protein|uniref:Uncharacterized protein n=1 Tax=Clostridium acetireducens DSM 10703 TaxID=1121290 RepID=A0A1E8F0W6_9CLOT|nr:hypothetical protein [Clostridium acetireducens]OFI07078.1 hypothetical protein CLOACE_04830 [Clostridium acetireducens DSM 10703]